MKNKFVLLSLICVFLVVAILAYLKPKPSSDPKKIIAVFTTQSHPALERARAGFISAFKAKMGPDIKIIDYNAEGNMQQANIIARQIAQDKNIVGIFAIASLAAQTVAKAEKNIPIIIAAVSDPEVIMPFGQTTQNIDGLSDTIDADFQIRALLDLLPSTKSIALLYSPHEANSSAVVKKLEARAQALGLRTNLVGVYEPQQIATASLSACENSDLVLIPLDNQLAASMPAVIKATKNKPCPVIISDEALIKHGASIAFGVDYQKSGEQAAELMLDILSGSKKSGSIGFINPGSIGIFVNERIMREKNIMINPKAHTKFNIYEGQK